MTHKNACCSLLHGPDFFGFGSGIELATARRDLVEPGWRGRGTTARGEET
jgi:hypothetical protein